MDVVDPAGEWLRLAERYRQMSDEELLVLARAGSDLTDTAQQAIAGELRHRGLKTEPEAPAPEPVFEPPPELASDLSAPTPDDDDAYADERKLVELCTVWSVRDALQLQWLLDRAGIPFFIGPEKATDVDAVTSDFVKGASVQIMRVGEYWARQAMQHYEPADAPPAEPIEEGKEIPVRCPQCHSTDVVFEDLTGEPSNSNSRFQWTCDQCGNRWEDDGVVSEQ